MRLNWFWRYNTFVAHASDKLTLPLGQRILRLLSTVILTICALMAILGFSLWSEELQGPLFALYWSWCFLLAMVAIFLGLWDMLLVRRAFKRRRRELFRDEFMTKEFVEKIKDAIDKDEG